MSWDEYYADYLKQVADGTYRPRGMHSYSGQLLHVAGSAITARTKAEVDVARKLAEEDPEKHGEAYRKMICG